ncbi:hypothetical protein RD792_005705 [Penstemon davidsonii]|uniref:Beta-glucosidase n=1 Tax=Penstemon davidsonii TaxID=160366 RepID=A0ABR0DFB8_9LAMI|nr:hypothetical protein RD792_005705 [Penstemon davidsonii]
MVASYLIKLYRVKNWITFNEGWTSCNYGYVAGTFPPGHGLSSVEQRNSKYRCCGYKGAWIQRVCSKGDAGTEPYQAAHNMLLAHAHAVDVYRKLFQTSATWLFIVTRGIYNLLVYVKGTYNTDLIYITENGMAEVNNPNLTISKARMEPLRVRYYNEHLWYLRKAIMEGGVNVKAYFLWSFADNFEWAEGYTSRFGIFYIDFKDGRYTRVPKTSAIWWKNFFTKKS